MYSKINSPLIFFENISIILYITFLVVTEYKYPIPYPDHNTKLNQNNN